MDRQWNELLVGLADAGCTRDEIEGAEKLIKAERSTELAKYLKKCRASLLDDMHESQKRVDRMDYLIRQAEKILTK